jgi:hypothetical protein
VANIKFYNDSDYNMLAKWWIDHDQIPCPRNLLPNLGFIIDDMVAGFLYQTDSGVCFFETVISKKDSDKDERREALDKLIETIVDSAKEMKYKRLIFHTLHPRLADEVSKKWECTKWYGSNERFVKELI